MGGSHSDGRSKDWLKDVPPDPEVTPEARELVDWLEGDALKQRLPEEDARALAGLPPSESIASIGSKAFLQVGQAYDTPPVRYEGGGLVLDGSPILRSLAERLEQMGFPETARVLMTVADSPEVRSLEFAISLPVPPVR